MSILAYRLRKQDLGRQDREVGILTDKKADILDSGRALFRSKGLKRTKVSDIAKAAGVGVGTFYEYYPSKEKLFLEVFIKESENIKKHILESIDLNDDPLTMVTKFVTQNISAMNSDLVLKEWYNSSLCYELKQSLFDCGGLESIDKFICNDKAELYKRWKLERKIRDDLDDGLINIIFNSLLYIDIHKSEIGVQHFPQILYYITEFIIKGITDS